ncbi:MarR family transcriptional regulator [Paenibacillus oryzisoli]|uniref:MarR family winged helix-turn-helix transcriptional regulator n=1 Tax=Paenibacillus oryzisoli TaxID=1850517 RepID=UPI003D2668BC
MENKTVDKHMYEQLANFRYRLRCFVHFSEQAVRQIGLTPQSHQLLLAIMGFPEREYATPSELAEKLQLSHHACTGLINRCKQMGIIERRPNLEDGRSTFIHLTHKGRILLERLSEIHLQELNRIGFLTRSDGI